jgi:hypothetical protein
MICEFFRRLWENQGWALRYMGYERWNDLTQFALSGVDSISLTGSITAEILNCSHLNFRFEPPAYLSESRLLRFYAAENHSTSCISKKFSCQDNKFQSNRFSESNQQDDYLIIKNNSQDMLSDRES